MEREAKKRKTEYVEGEEKGKEDDDDDEEEKMEKFFALLRSTKQMHDQIRRNSNIRIFKEKEEIRKVGEEKVSIVAWNPSFLPEDFLEDGKDSQAAAGPSKRKEAEKKDDGEEGTALDLKLSL
ncbi:hypothetical protein D5086_009694 [Populus alba]|uniref:Uncharacterized protein n=3 Tax=Populus TaxID=3689 RepID=A0ACC4C8D3_POPAL|nr:hypothetical protein D5086_0000219450 [Populus alba]